MEDVDVSEQTAVLQLYANSRQARYHRRVEQKGREPTASVLGKRKEYAGILYDAPVKIRRRSIKTSTKLVNKRAHLSTSIRPTKSVPTRIISAFVARKFGLSSQQGEGDKNELIEMPIRGFDCNDGIERFDITGIAANMSMTHSNRDNQLIYPMPLECFKNGGVIRCKVQSINGRHHETYLLSLDALRAFAQVTRLDKTRARAEYVIGLLETKEDEDEEMEV